MTDIVKGSHAIHKVVLTNWKIPKANPVHNRNVSAGHLGPLCVRDKNES